MLAELVIAARRPLDWLAGGWRRCLGQELIRMPRAASAGQMPPGAPPNGQVFVPDMPAAASPVGRRHVELQALECGATNVLGHRLVLTCEADADECKAKNTVGPLLDHVATASHVRF